MGIMNLNVNDVCICPNNKLPSSWANQTETHQICYIKENWRFAELLLSLISVKKGLCWIKTENLIKVDPLNLEELEKCLTKDFLKTLIQRMLDGSLEKSLELALARDRNI